MKALSLSTLCLTFFVQFATAQSSEDTPYFPSRENIPVAVVSSIENQLELEWYTCKEVNASYFIVLRSDNGSDFYIVDRVTASGSDNFRNFYAASVEMPGDGETVLYRVELVDLNGRHYSSGLVSIAVPEEYASNE